MNKRFMNEPSFSKDLFGLPIIGIFLKIIPIIIFSFNKSVYFESLGISKQKPGYDGGQGDNKNHLKYNSFLFACRVNPFFAIPPDGTT